MAFLACFSAVGVAQERSYQREELILAIEELRLRDLEVPWLIPVRFDDRQLPEWSIGPGRTLSSLNRIDLFGDRRPEQMSRLVDTVGRLLGPGSVATTAVFAEGPADRLLGIVSVAGYRTGRGERPRR